MKLKRYLPVFAAVLHALVLAALSNRFNLGSLRDELIQMVMAQSTGWWLHNRLVAVFFELISNLQFIMPFIIDEVILKNDNLKKIRLLL